MPARAPRRIPRAIPALAVALLLVAGCSMQLGGAPTPIPGMGDVATQDRTAGAFTTVSAGAGIKVVVAVGTVRAVSLTAQPNLLPLIHTDVADGQLVVTVDAPGISATRNVVLKVATPTLTAITLADGATGTLEVDTDTFGATLSGGAILTAIGRAASLTLTASGGATAQLEELKSDTATVAMTGGSTATLNVATTLTGTADAGATIRLLAKPGTMNVKTSGGATVTGG